MPPDGSVKVKVFHALVPQEGSGHPIQFGSMGKAVELLGVNWVWAVLNYEGYRSLYVALSSNPRHELTPPGYADWFADKALYARQHIDVIGIDTGGHGGWDHHLYMPLYGLIRPNRQVVVFWNGAGESVKITLEYYYREAVLTQKDQDDLNLVYGKYRRER